METNNLNLKQSLIHTMAKAVIEKGGINALDSKTIGQIRYLANELSENTGNEKETTEEKKSYPSFYEYMSEKTARILRNYTGIETPEQLAEYDFKDVRIGRFIPNIELLQYAMYAGIKLKNYRY